MKLKLFITLIIISTFIVGQEIDIKLIDQHEKVMKFCFLTVYDDGKQIFAENTDSNGIILMNDSLLDMKYHFSLLRTMCFSDTILIDKKNNTLSCHFNDSCRSIEDRTVDIRRRADNIDLLETTPIDSGIIKLDSIEISYHLFKNKVVSESLFLNSRTILRTNLYYQENRCFGCFYKEMDKNLDLHLGTIFFIENDSIFHTEKYRTQYVGISSWDIFEGYNRNLTNEFLAKYFVLLLKEIKLPTTKCKIHAAKY